MENEPGADDLTTYLSEISSASVALLKAEKLALFLDIDNTILHAIVTYDIPYTLFTNSATKDMFVFQMETPEPFLPTRDTSPPRRYPQGRSPHRHHSHPRPNNKSHFVGGQLGLPSRLEHSSDSVPKPSTHALPSANSDAEHSKLDDSSSSNDSDSGLTLIGSAKTSNTHSRSGSTEYHFETSSNSSNSSRNGSLRLNDVSRAPNNRSRTPNIESFDDNEPRDFDGKPLYCLVKPRPGIISFLRSARPFFRIYICTFGSLEYASEIRTRLNALVAKGDKTPMPPALEPQIIAREAHRTTFPPHSGPTSPINEEVTCKNEFLCPLSPPATPSPHQSDSSAVSTSSSYSQSESVDYNVISNHLTPSQPKPLAQTLRKSLKTILASLGMDIDERLCVCLDDRLDVWTEEDMERNVLKIHPYSFFFSHPIYELQAAEHGLHRHLVAAPPKLNLDLSSLNDDALRASWITLSNIHRKFFHRLNALRSKASGVPNGSINSTAPQQSSSMSIDRQIVSAPPGVGQTDSSTHENGDHHPQKPIVASEPNGIDASSANGVVVPAPQRATMASQFEILPSALLPSVQPYITSFRLPVLRGVIIAHQGKLVRDILLLATYFGAQVLDSFNSAATHFLVSSIDEETCKDVRRRMQNDEVFNKQVFVVTCSWITDCARDRRHVPEAPYLLSSRRK